LAQTENNEITSAIVHQKAAALRQELTDLAAEMGIDLITSEPIDVTDVSPREVYFQAATLRSKTSQLMFEFTSKEGKPIIVNKINASPVDVIGLLYDSESHLLEVATKLTVVLPKELPELDDRATPRDVFQLIVQLNRLTNQLLDFKFSPAESHQKVTESIALASAILQTYPKADAVFYPHTYIPRKTPTDVYQKMAGMYQELSLLFAKFEKTCLILGDSEKQRRNVQPSDVYDLAVLFSSQLGFWHSILPTQPEVKKSYYPGKVLPSDVYQRLSILEQQVHELMRINDVVKTAT
jgi:hypothetical protein